MKIIIKDIRAELRNYVGRFQVYTKEWKKRASLLEKMIFPLFLRHIPQQKKGLIFILN